MPVKRLLHIIFTCTCLFASYNLQAQDNDIPYVSGEYKNMSAEKFLLQMEKQTGFHLYFDSSQLDSIVVDISVNKKPLTEVLKLAFITTKLEVAYYAPDNIFISKGLLVQTELPNGFLNKGKRTKNEILQDSSFENYTNAENRVQNATLQNKLYVIGGQNPSNNPARKTITGFILDNK